MIWSKRDFVTYEQIRKAHADLVATPDFRTAVTVSLMEYVNQQQSVLNDILDKGNSQEGAAIAFRIQGARQFVDVLMNLHELPASHKHRDYDNLARTD